MVLPRDKISIAGVDFGRLDSETETSLQDYFVDTGVLGKLRNGRKNCVLGRKGAGKTAVSQLATLTALGRDVIPVEFTNYPWELHKQICETGLPAESAYEASWRFMFLIALCRHWTESAPHADLKRKAAAFVRRIYLDEEPRIGEILVDKLRRIRHVQLPEVPGILRGGAFELESAPPGPALASSISQWCQVLMEFVKANFDRSPFTIKIDRLDDGWDASPAAKSLLAGVLKASRDMNIALNRPGQPAVVITFLRTDIFDELQFNDKNKTSGDIEHLDWPDEKLLEVAQKRIARSLDCAIDEAWDMVFERTAMRGGASVQNYMLKRTMGRPRDMIAFCQKCQEVAHGRGHSIVEKQDVYEAEERYSDHIYNELDDEMHKQLPQAKGYMQTIRDVGRTRFKADRWIEAAVQRDTAITKDQALAQLKTLFDYSILGVPRSPGVLGGNVVDFSYRDRFLAPNFDSDLIVHPSLKRVLRLVEARADQSGEETETEDPEKSQ